MSLTTKPKSDQSLAKSPLWVTKILNLPQILWIEVQEVVGHSYISSLYNYNF